MNQNYYLSALYLSFTIALLCFILFIYLESSGFGRARSATIYIGGAVATGIGLWVQSNLLRFAGGLWFAASSIAIFWPLLFGENISWSAGVLLFIPIGMLSLAAAYIMLLSKSFGIEFRAARERQPSYKRFLRKAFIIILIVGAVIATAIDIYNLMTT